MRWIALAVVGCGASSTPSTPGEATAEAPPAACRGVAVDVTPPSDADRAAGNVATLRGSFAGDGMGKRAETICLTAGSQRRSIPMTFSVEIRASASELQRVTIDGVPILVGMRPGSELAIGYHPCANWQLHASWLDSGTMDDGVAVKRAAACPDGMVEGGEIHEANDPHCGGVDGECAWRRCVRGAAIEVGAGTPSALVITSDITEGSLVDRVEPGASVAIAPYGGFCPSFEAITDGKEHVRVAPGRGERWRLTVDGDGRIAGSYVVPET